MVACQLRCERGLALQAARVSSGGLAFGHGADATDGDQEFVPGPGPAGRRLFVWFIARMTCRLLTQAPAVGAETRLSCQPAPASFPFDMLLGPSLPGIPCRNAGSVSDSRQPAGRAARGRFCRRLLASLVSVSSSPVRVHKKARPLRLCIHSAHPLWRGWRHSSPTGAHVGTSALFPGAAVRSLHGGTARNGGRKSGAA